MKTDSIHKFVICIVLFTFCYSCSDPAENPQALWEEEFNLNMEALPDIEMPQEEPKTLVNTDTIFNAEEYDEYNVIVREYREAEGDMDQILLDPTTRVIYPGALVKGESIMDGSYVNISAKRNPVTLSVSLKGANNISVIVDDPKLSTTREAINDLMSQNFSPPEARVLWDIVSANSAEQLDMELHASYKGSKLKLSAGFNYTSKEVRTRLLAKFMQIYYTIDMDSPYRPSDLFAENIDPTFFGTYAPMYVGSVHYGRMAFFSIESELSEDSLRAYINGSYNKISGNASVDYNQFLSTTKTKAYAIGGSGEDATELVDGFEGFLEYIKGGGAYSKDSPGAAIAYTLNNIRDNKTTAIVLAANYTIRELIPKYDFTIKATKIKSNAGGDSGDSKNNEIVGHIKCWPEGKKYKEVNLWKYDGDKYKIELKEWTNLNLEIDAVDYNIIKDDPDFMNASAITVDFDIDDRDAHTRDDPLGAGTVKIPMSEITAENTGKYEKEIENLHIQILIEFTYPRN